MNRQTVRWKKYFRRVFFWNCDENIFSNVPLDGSFFRIFDKIMFLRYKATTVVIRKSKRKIEVFFVTVFIFFIKTHLPVQFLPELLCGQHFRYKNSAVVVLYPGSRVR